jgi:TonB family protein
MKPRRDPIRFIALVVTILLHGGALGGIVWAHLGPAAPVIMPREFMVAKIVRFGRKRPPNLLPTIPAEPPPTAPKAALQLTDNEQAKGAPKTEKPPPDAKPGDLRTALSRARDLARLETQAEQEGDPTGDPQGNSDTASEGDAYITKLSTLYHNEYKGLDFLRAQNLSARVRIFIDAQGNVLTTRLLSSSGNAPFDSKVAEVLERVKHLPPPPASRALRYERSGIDLEFTP